MALFLKLTQHAANHIAAHAGTSTLQLSEGEFPWETIDRSFNQNRLCATRRFHFACALFELTVPSRPVRRYQPCAIPDGGPLCLGAIGIVESVSSENSPLSIQRLFFSKNAPTKCGLFEIVPTASPRRSA